MLDQGLNESAVEHSDLSFPRLDSSHVAPVLLLFVFVYH
jgi:hypothetical protein